MFPPALEAGLSPGTDTRTLGLQETWEAYGHQSAVRRKFPLITFTFFEGQRTEWYWGCLFTSLRASIRSVLGQ